MRWTGEPRRTIMPTQNSSYLRYHCHQSLYASVPLKVAHPKSGCSTSVLSSSCPALSRAITTFASCAYRERARSCSPYRMKISGIGINPRDRNPNSDTTKKIAVNDSDASRERRHRRTAPFSARSVEEEIRRDGEYSRNDRPCAHIGRARARIVDPICLRHA